MRKGCISSVKHIEEHHASFRASEQPERLIGKQREREVTKIEQVRTREKGVGGEGVVKLWSFSRNVIIECPRERKTERERERNKERKRESKAERVVYH